MMSFVDRRRIRSPERLFLSSQCLNFGLFQSTDQKIFAGKGMQATPGPAQKGKRKFTVEFGDVDNQDLNSPEPTIKKNASTLPREFEIEELKTKEIQKTEIESDKLVAEDDETTIEDCHFYFPVSFKLVNLLRNPEIDLDKHDFKPGFLESVRDILATFKEEKPNVKELLKQTGLGQNHFTIYVHLAIAYSSSLENMFSMCKVPYEAEQVSKEVNFTNIINVWAIVEGAKAAKKTLDTSPKTKEPSPFKIFMVKGQGGLVGNMKLTLSFDHTLYCMKSKGRMDIHFQSYVLNFLPTNQFPLQLAYCKSPKLFTQGYSAKMIEIISTYEQRSDMKQWAEQQLSDIVANKADLKELKFMVVEGIQNQHLESLLIGMLGWGGEITDDAVRLLNIYYDGVDWQLRSPFRPVISSVGKRVKIDYLVDDQKCEQDLVFLIKTRSFDPYCKQEVISFHRPKLLRYINQEKSYLWVQLEVGRFTQVGYFDWKLVRLNERGVTSSVIKILNMDEWKTALNLPEQFNKIKNARPVQGRFIVQPRNVLDLQIHEVVVDMQGSQDGKGSFAKVLKELDTYKEMGINCLYLMGVFERDNGPIIATGGKVLNYKRPNASPLAVVCRNAINSMLGGEAQFKKVCDYANKIGMKIIVDCLARISSTRFDRKYRQYINHGLDENGKLKIIYGTDGRSLNYEDTAIMNYRKKAVWDLLVDEVLDLIERFGIHGIHLDNGQAWPQIFKLDLEELLRFDAEKRKAYTDREIFEGSVVLQDENCGYWGSELRFSYPNPFLVRLCKAIWSKYPEFLIISESWAVGGGTEERCVSIINSGPIPRMFKLPMGISLVFGQQLHKDGRVSKVEPRSLNGLKKWYQQTVSVLPKGAVVIQSTTSDSWPYPAFIYRRATWAVVDLFFFLPDLPMTFIGEQQGQAFRTKGTMLFSTAKKQRSKSRKHASIQGANQNESAILKSVDSQFFDHAYDNYLSESSSFSMNSSVRESNQISRLQESFVKEIGPQYGYNLREIYKHYRHRRLLRQSNACLRKGRLMSVQAQHQYGLHTHVIAFVRWTEKAMVLIAINFNQGPIYMHFNLKSLKYLFPNSENSNIVVEIRDMLDDQEKEEDNFWVIHEFITSRIEVNIKGYKSLLWQVKIHKDGSKLEWAYKCSNKRLAKRISQTPARWIYTSNLTNNLIKLVDSQSQINNFMNSLLYLFQSAILPNNFDLNTVISKTHQFWGKHTSIFKLYGYFKKIANTYREVVPEIMLNVIDKILVENKLGPIAFITPEIGKWSTVGGLGVMVDELSKELAKIGEEVIVVSPYYEFNKKGKTGYLADDGFTYKSTITVWASGIKYDIGLHTGQLNGITYLWLHNSELFSMPYKGEEAIYVTKQLVFFALGALQAFCQLKLFPSMIVTNDWFCGFVSAYVKNGRYPEVFKGSKFMHIVHNLDPLYEGRLYPRYNEGDLGWLTQLPREWVLEPDSGKTVINPSRCALSTCDNWGTVSHSYKYDLLKESPLASILWKFPNPFSFPNGVRKNQRQAILQTKTPGNHIDSKRLIQMKYFKCDELENIIPVLSFVGRVTRQKGVHLILEVIERLLTENNFKIQFLIGGPSDAREEYGKYCAERMKYLKKKYPKNVWADPDSFFEDGPLINIGSDFGLMPSLFEPGGIVQHEFFSGSTPVISYKTGGLKDTVFQYDFKTQKGNGFNFLNYNPDDFRQCVQRALNCYKNPQHYQKCRRNAGNSVIDVEDVAKAWNNEFHRIHGKIFVQWNMVDKEMQEIKQLEVEKVEPDGALFEKVQGNVWSEENEVKKTFEKVLISAQRLQAKPCEFSFHTERLPRPKEISIAGDWDNWKAMKPLKFDSFSLMWKITLVLQPGTYYYKYVIEEMEWVCSPHDPIEVDIKGVANNKVIIE